MSGLSVAVLGPGAVGGFLAALLWRKGIAVTCVATEAAAGLIAREGIRLESEALGDFVARPSAAARLDEEVVALFVTTKFMGLERAIQRVDPRRVARGVVIPLLNGIEHMPVLRARYGARVIAASIGNVEVRRLGPTHIVHSTASARIELASDEARLASRLNEIAGRLSEAGIPATVLTREADVLWGKLVRLNAIACATSAHGGSLGDVRSDPRWRELLEGCVREGAAVAAAEGAPTDPAAVMASIGGLPAGIRSSMQRDVEAGKPSELDAIAGAVVRAGARHGLPCPVIESLISRIQARIAGPGRLRLEAVTGS
jgi:2-dehydropantoate 2-reductase